MDIEKLCNNYEELIQYMEDNQYTPIYIGTIKSEIKWLRNNKDNYKFESYADICNARSAMINSIDKRYHCRSIYLTLQQFEECSEFPNRHKREPLIKRGAYHQLSPAFKEIIDLYQKYAERAGHSENTFKKCMSKASCFLLYLQHRGHTSLSTVEESEVMSFFTDSAGELSRSRTYKQGVETVLRGDLGIHTDDARKICAFLPAIKKRRKNIRYLACGEIESLRDAIENTQNDITLRDRAIGMLLYYTGVRAGDIAELRQEEIDWDGDIIRLSQGKTGSPLELPLIATVGNALYDYIVKERPQSRDNHVFLWSLPPYDPISADAIWPISAKLYKAAGIRQSEGDRRGSHLFRHHLATSLAENGISQPVISGILGHEVPSSLDVYLATDMVHLRECALSIEQFPVGDEVFRI